MFRLLKILFLFTFICCFILIINYSSIIYDDFDDFHLTVNQVPGDYLSEFQLNESYCNFHYSLPENFLYNDVDLKYPPEQGVSSPYRVLYNIIEGKFGDLPQLTFATHITVDFINYLAEIARFWEGPISVAAFVPDFDADLAVQQLQHFCQCLPEMSKISLHFVFPINSPPYLRNIDENDLMMKTMNCKISDSRQFQTFRYLNNLKYPINVCRNIARNLAETEQVIVADVQLIPSRNLATNFIKFLNVYNNNNKKNPSLVFVVPVFEIIDFTIPLNKQQLLYLIKNERAVYFHRYICTHCQKFPGITSWIESNTNTVKPFTVVKREYPYQRWEPIYIGTKNEPFYNENMSWEGVQDKMSQMLEMCLIGYNFMILDGVFMVHWPGIKKHHNKKLKQSQYRRENSKIYDQLVKNLRRKYGKNSKCGI